MTRLSRATCYHEAGHAVAAFLAGVGIHAIHVKPGGDWSRYPDNHTDILGFVELDEGSYVPRGLTKWRKWRPAPLIPIAANSIFISIAGELAEIRAGRRTFDHGWRRSLSAQQTYDGCFRDYELVIDYFHSEGMAVPFERRRWTSHIPKDRIDVARAIVALGLSQSDAAAVLRAAFDAVRATVCSGRGWRAVEHITRAIHRNGGYLDGPTVQVVAQEYLGDPIVRRAIQARAAFSCSELEAIPTKDRPSYPMHMFV